MGKSCFMCGVTGHLIEACPKLQAFIKEQVNEHRALSPPQISTLSQETLNEIQMIFENEVKKVRMQSQAQIFKLNTQIEVANQQLNGVIAYLAVIAEHVQRITGVRK